MGRFRTTLALIWILGSMSTKTGVVFFCASFGVVFLSGGSWLHQREGAVVRVCACEEQ